LLFPAAQVPVLFFSHGIPVLEVTGVGKGFGLKKIKKKTT
jgi:hypothetical protein